MSDLPGVNVDLSTSPVAYQFLQDKSFVTGICGAVGSGKSYVSCLKVMKIALEQQPAEDNVRYSRFVIVRNSYPELKTTTIKTWTDIFPESTFGPLRWTPPITHHIKLPPRDGASGVDCEVIFMAVIICSNWLARIWIGFAVMQKASIHMCKRVVLFGLNMMIF